MRGAWEWDIRSAQEGASGRSGRYMGSVREGISGRSGKVHPVSPGRGIQSVREGAHPGNPGSGQRGNIRRTARKYEMDMKFGKFG